MRFTIASDAKEHARSGTRLAGHLYAHSPNRARLTQTTSGLTLMCMTVFPLPALPWRRVVAALAFTLAFSLAGADRPKVDKPAAAPTPANFNIPLWPQGKVPLASGNGPLD